MRIGYILYIMMMMMMMMLYNNVIIHVLDIIIKLYQIYV